MKKLNLNHESTPQTLADVNLEIEALLAAPELDDERLKALVETRDQVINTHLESLSGDQKTAFAQSELAINDTLSAIVKEHFKHSLKQLSGLKRGHKAVKKYK